MIKKRKVKIENENKKPITINLNKPTKIVENRNNAFSSEGFSI